jgi:hypothetical protein
MLFNAEASTNNASRVTAAAEEYKKKWNPQNQSLVTLCFDRKRDWILVPNGSFFGYFDWVPLYLRKGPWSPLAYVNLVGTGIILGISFWYYHGTTEAREEEIFNQQQQLGSATWLYNGIACLWMSFILYRILRVTSTFILTTYTIQSWVALLLRHFMAVLLPILPQPHPNNNAPLLLNFVTILYRRLRFHVLFSATVTFFIWNFLLFPYVYLVALKGKPTAQRNRFVRWNFSFHLQQIHLCNIIFAYLNTIVYDYFDHKLFDGMDLWVAAFCIWIYTLFYVLVLDRFGIHLYPIFSPRSHLGMALSGTLIWGILYTTFVGWNTWIRR